MEQWGRAHAQELLLGYTIGDGGVVDHINKVVVKVVVDNCLEGGMQTSTGLLEPIGLGFGTGE
jgi:hypothetical protein